MFSVLCMLYKTSILLNVYRGGLCIVQAYVVQSIGSCTQKQKNCYHVSALKRYDTVETIYSVYAMYRAMWPVYGGREASKTFFIEIQKTLPITLRNCRPHIATTSIA